MGDHTGRPVEPVCRRSQDGRRLGIRDIRLEAGPAATDGTHATVARRNSIILGDDPA